MSEKMSFDEIVEAVKSRTPIVVVSKSKERSPDDDKKEIIKTTATVGFPVSFTFCVGQNPNVGLVDDISSCDESANLLDEGYYRCADLPEARKKIADIIDRHEKFIQEYQALMSVTKGGGK